MSVVKAALKGFWRVVASPGLVFWLWLANFAVALPVGLVMASSIRSSVGESLVDGKLRSGFDMGWYGEFREKAKGLETTFTPTVLGAGAFYSNLESWLTGDLFKGFSGLIGLGVSYALLWALFVGGVLDRYTGAPGRFSLSRFFSSGGKFFFRFVRLAILSGVLYFLIYRFSSWLFRTIEQATRDVTVERTVFFYTLLGAALVVLALTFVNMSFDYAKIATFKEERKSMLVAALRGFRFVLSHPGKTFGLYYSLGAVGVALLLVYGWMAPGAGQSNWFTVALAFLAGQIFLVAKLMLRLVFYAGQLVLFESATPGRPVAAGE
ncbi:MAG: hypothetical protein ACE5JI_18200 [Acidobacteriota bacterium]